jgi:hypothetical protein
MLAVQKNLLKKKSMLQIRAAQKASGANVVDP